MNTFTNIKDAVLSLIDASQLSFAEIERRSGVARTQIYRWKSTEVTHPRFDSVERIAKSLGYGINIKDNIVTVQPHTDSGADRGDEMDLLIQTQNKLIEQYEDKIKMLGKELAEKNDLVNSKQKRPSGIKEISDMLHDASEQWSWVFYHTDKPMSCTRKGTLRNVNPALCKLLGYTEDEMLGKNLLEFIHPDDHKRAVIEIKKAERNIKVRVKKSSGNYCMVKITAQEFGVNGHKFSVALITCIQKGCPDC